MNDHTADQTARELIFLAGPHDEDLIGDDGVVDGVAISVAADGIRRVRLTHAERLEAARRILQQGGSIRCVCRRLGLREVTEKLWEQLERKNHDS